MVLASGEKLKARILKLHAWASGCFIDPSFEDQSQHSVIVGEIPNIDLYDKRKADLVVGWEKLGKQEKENQRPLYEEPLLTKPQLDHLFCHYNFLKWQVLQILESSQAKKTPTRCFKQAMKKYRQAVGVRSQIASANLRMVWARLKKYKFNAFFEDKLSEGYFTVLYSVDKFDWRRGISFGAYVGMAILNSSARMHKREDKQDSRRDEGAMLSQIASCEENLTEDIADDEEARLRRSEQKLFLQYLMSHLTERERIIINSSLIDGLTNKDIGIPMGIDRERVRQIKSAATTKIVKILKGMGMNPSQQLMDIAETASSMTKKNRNSYLKSSRRMQEAA